MVHTLTPNKALIKPANGDDVDSWDVPVNADWDIIDLSLGGSVTINVVAAAGTVALTLAQYRPPQITFSGLLTADVNYQLPTAGIGGEWTVNNASTGAHTITFSSAGGGTSVVLPQGARTNIACDGTNVFIDSAAAGANSDITSLNALGITGVVKGTGASAPLVAATAGTDYAKPNTDSVWTGTENFQGTTAKLAAILTNAAETGTISASAATGTIAYYVSSQSILYFTSSAAANWIVNLTYASTPTTLNTVMTTGQFLTVVFAVTQGATAHYNTAVQVDGTTSGVTTVWQGGAPTSGNVSGIDVYSYVICKTANATFTVFASLVQFK